MAGTRILVEGSRDRVAIISGKILFEFFLSRGLYTLTFADQAHLINHALVAFRGNASVVESSSYPEVRWKMMDLSDDLGEGKAFVVHFSGKPELPAMTADFSFYEGKDLLAIGVQIDNTTGGPVVLHEIFPILCKGKGGGLLFGETSHCRVLRSDWSNLEQRPHLFSPEAGGRLESPNSLLLSDGKSGAALACGIFEPARCATTFVMSCSSSSKDSIQFRVRQRPTVAPAGRQAPPGFTLRENASFFAGRIALAFDEDPHAALEKYGGSIGTANHVDRLERIPCGWSSRSPQRGGAPEEDILSHVAYIAEHLKQYGLKDILVDAGWQISGDFSGGPWNPGHAFPNGMKSLAETAHAAGLAIGLWVRPLDLESMRLDPSGEFAKTLLQKDAARISKSWGFDFIKLDFVEWDAFQREDRFLPEDDSSTIYEAVRSVLVAMKSGLPPNAFLLGSNAASPVSFGVIQAAGIAGDVDVTRWQTVREDGVKAAALRYHLHNSLWVNDPGYLSMGTQATLAQATAWASLIALSGGCMFATDHLPSLSEKKLSILKKIIPPFGKAARPIDLLERMSPQIWVLEIKKPFSTWHILGLFNWDPTQKEITEGYRLAVQSNLTTLRENDKNEGIERSSAALRKIAADNRLIRKENERIASFLERSAIAKTRLGFLRPLRKARKSPRFRNVKVSFRKAGLDASLRYLVYDFWADAFLGEHRGSLTTLVKLAGCRVLAFHPRLDRPQLLSTNRHVTQGGIELEDLGWDENRVELWGKSAIVGEDDYSVTLHVPRDYRFVDVKANCAECRPDTRPAHIVRLRFKNPKSKRITWRAKFEKVR